VEYDALIDDDATDAEMLHIDDNAKEDDIEVDVPPATLNANDAVNVRLDDIANDAVESFG